jgi:hypothetical protein
MGRAELDQLTGERREMSGTETQSDETSTLDKEVRGYFRECKLFSMRKILDAIQDAKITLEISTETIRKRHRDHDERLAGLEDLRSLKLFFTSHKVGRQLRGLGPTSSGEQGEEVATSQSGASIGPGERVRPVAPTELASITIAGDRWGQGTVSVAISLYCGIFNEFALQRGIISLDPHPGAMTKSHREAWNADRTHSCKVKERDSSVVLRCYKSERNPVWQIDGQGQPIGNWNYPDFANLEGLSPGDAVTVIFSSWRQDMVFEDTTGELAKSASGNYEVDDRFSGGAEGSPSLELDELRCLVDSMLRQDEIVTVIGQGRVELSRDVLNIGKPTRKSTANETPGS